MSKRMRERGNSNASSGSEDGSKALKKPKSWHDHTGEEHVYAGEDEDDDQDNADVNVTMDIETPGNATNVGEASAAASSMSAHAAPGTDNTATINETSTLKIIHIDVAQGESTLLIYSQGKAQLYTMLIDGGRSSYEARIHATIKHYGVSKLHAIVVSHYDADHMEGITALLERAHEEQSKPANDGSRAYIDGSTRVYHRGLPESAGNNDKFLKLTRALRNFGITLTSIAKGNVLKPDTPQDCPFSITCLYARDGEIPPNEENDASVMLEIKLGQFTYYTGGDQGKENEKKYVKPCTAFKCGHHGSKHSTSSAMLTKTQAAVAIISAGRHSYCHPNDEVLELLDQATHIKGIYLTNCVYNRPQVNPDYVATEKELWKRYFAPLAHRAEEDDDEEPLLDWYESEDPTDVTQGELYTKFIDRLVKPFMDSIDQDVEEAEKEVEEIAETREAIQKETTEVKQEKIKKKEKKAIISAYQALKIYRRVQPGAAPTSGSVVNAASSTPPQPPRTLKSYVAGTNDDLGNIEIDVGPSAYQVKFVGADGKVNCHEYDFNGGMNEVETADKIAVSRKGGKTSDRIADFSEISAPSAEDELVQCNHCTETGSRKSFSFCTECNRMACSTHVDTARDVCDSGSDIPRSEEEEKSEKRKECTGLCMFLQMEEAEASRAKALAEWAEDRARDRAAASSGSDSKRRSRRLSQKQDVFYGESQ